MYVFWTKINLSDKKWILNIRSFTYYLYFKLLIILLSFGNPVFAADVTDPKEKLDIRVAYTEVIDPNDPAFYYQQVLKLALDKTRDQFGNYELSFFDEIYTADRRRQMVASGQHADVIWASVTPQRKRNMQVIPVNLLRNFNNYRLLLVRSQQKNIFKKVKTIAQLKKYSAGNGLNWTDTRILESIDIPVVTSVQYGYLINMLQSDRFDYISRGLHEIDADLKMFPHADLAIAQGIVLKYKYPVFYSYFVTHSNTSLAKRLQAGLLIAEQDGSFKQAYESIPSYKAGIEQLKEARHVIELDNRIILKQ